MWYGMGNSMVITIQLISFNYNGIFHRVGNGFFNA